MNTDSQINPQKIRELLEFYPSEIGRVFHGVYGCDLCSQKCYV